MSRSDFDKFLSQSADAQIQEIDWDKTKSDFLLSVNQFFSDVKEYLKDYIKAGKIILREDKIEIFEEDIGTYEAPRLHIEIRGREACFSPAGSHIIGARGRIDLVGPRGEVRFLLVSRNAKAPHIKGSHYDSRNPKSALTADSDRLDDSVWKIATSPPDIAFIDFNEDIFFDVLIKVIDG